MAKRKKKRKVNRGRIIALVVALILVLVLCITLIKAVVSGISSLFSDDETPKEDKTEEITKKETKKKNKSSVSFVAVGDNLIHDTVYLDAQQEDGSYDFTKMFENVQDEIEEADVAFINQETVLGGEELGLSGYPTFNSPTEIAQNLEDVGFDMANLATNHCLDKSDIGIANELEAFSKTDIVVDGVYTSQEEFNTIPTFEKNGITFSFLAYTYGTNGIEPPYAYNVSYFDEDQIRNDVKKAKEISDVVIVSAHWGDENTFEPNGMQAQYAQLFADLEVDVVIGTHPHTIQPVEWIEGTNGNKTLVAYSLGNFIGGMLTTDNAIGGMLCFDVTKNKDTFTVENVEWKPTMIHFEGNQDNILAERYNYYAYLVEDYTDELANKHVLNGYDGNVVSLDYINQRTNSVIDKEFLK